VKPSIFFAIPCGEFYDEQARIIRKVCDRADVDPIIIEHDRKTSELWPTIADRIENADYFVADISSLRPNIVLELGYAFKAKPVGRYVFLVSKNVNVPADLVGKKRLEYIGYNDFQNQLINWLEQVVGVDQSCFRGLRRASPSFHDEFQDFDKFLRLWSTPLGCDFTLTSEGLRFTNAHLPILTKGLGLLTNLRFSFIARIERGAIGWVIKGTTDYRINFPPFCVMFNINPSGELKPHILNANQIHPDAFYQPFNSQPTQLRKTKQGWFNITTECIDDTITVFNDRRVLFRANFAKDAPYAQYYAFSPKQGHVGFRCHPWGEEAIVKKVRVEEI
jgi:hypothetical protein